MVNVMKLSEIIRTKNYEEFEAIDKSENVAFEEREIQPKDALKVLPKNHPVWTAFMELYQIGHGDKFGECYKIVDTGSYITLKVRGKDVEDYQATARSKKGETVYRTEIALRKYKPEPFETKKAEQIFTGSKVSNSWIGGKPNHKPL